jgi:hypothetical protein
MQGKNVTAQGHTTWQDLRFWKQMGMGLFSTEGWLKG